MQRGRFIFAAAVALAVAGARFAAPPAPAAETPPPVDVNLDFSKADVAGQLQINGDAQLVTEDSKQRLRLTDGSGQVSSVFTKTPLPAIGDYLATFDFQIQGSNGDADGAFMFLVQTAGADHIGGTGNNIGYTTATGRGPGANADEGFAGYGYGLAFSTLSGQNFVDNPEIVELNLMGSRTRLNPTPFKQNDQGLMHARIRVQPNQLTLTIQGGKDYATAKTVFTSPPYLGNGLFQAPQPVFVGFTASEGGGQLTDIMNLRIQSPAPAP